MLANIYSRLVIERPWVALVALLIATSCFALFVPQFELDASADSLLLEQDAELRYYRSIVARYGSDNYLVVTYTARRDLFSNAALTDLKVLRDELAAIESVDKVISILDVPLINSPRKSLADLQEHIPTLEDPRVDRELARAELTQSPIYSSLLTSLDGDTTALLVQLREDTEFRELNAERDHLRAKILSTGLSAEEQQVEEMLSRLIKQRRLALVDQEQADVAQIRSIIAGHQDAAELHLGGLPMIVSDMIEYIRHDIVVFGSAILAFLVLLLSVIFSRPRWVVISLLCCAVSVVIMVGLLGALEWRVTVVSSNFVALMLIFNLSLTVHLIQRYRELHAEFPTADQFWLVSATMRDKAQPCIYTAITTMVGFGSLLVSGIRPVIDFGWIMVMGMAVVLIVNLIMFPACVMLLLPGEPSDKGDSTQQVTGFFATLVDKRATVTSVFCIVLAIFSVFGLSQLQVENRFIDYFKQHTEIYQGMLKIDQKLGGTVPLDVVLDADPDFIAQQTQDALQRQMDDAASIDSDFDAEFADEFTGSEVVGADLGATSYWYNSYRLQRLRTVHDYLDSLPETGKVLSMATTLRTLETLNQDETPGTFFLSVLYKRLPQEIKAALYDPYMSADGNQVRISMRIYESDPGLQRDRLINDIRTHLVDELGFGPDQVHITGMLVLYNNVLQSLYRSQIMTLGVVFVAIMLMFALLFRSLRLAFVAVLPSILSAGVVLGVMGVAGIPLDIMTITIAAISVGIGVDDSIHYIHRYQQELLTARSAVEAMYRSHLSVGRAMFYTSVIVVAGFSILALSNFIPSILFGLLTSLAMTMALAANLTLLPLLLRRFSI